jgi:hypothetical protein
MNFAIAPYAQPQTTTPGLEQSKDLKIGHMEACIPRVVDNAADAHVEEQPL